MNDNPMIDPDILEDVLDEMEFRLTHCRSSQLQTQINVELNHAYTVVRRCKKTKHRRSGEVLWRSFNKLVDLLPRALKQRVIRYMDTTIALAEDSRQLAM